MAPETPSPTTLASRTWKITQHTMQQVDRARRALTSLRVGREGATWAGKDLDGTVSLATDDGTADAHTSGKPCEEVASKHATCVSNAIA